MVNKITFALYRPYIPRIIYQPQLFFPLGAVLWSQNERNLDCVVTFQTHSILQRFMLRFDMLQLDCNDHLYIYDGSHAVGTHKVSRTSINVFDFSYRSQSIHHPPTFISTLLSFHLNFLRKFLSFSRSSVSRS